MLALLLLSIFPDLLVIFHDLALIRNDLISQKFYFFNRKTKTRKRDLFRVFHHNVLCYHQSIERFGADIQQFVKILFDRLPTEYFRLEYFES